MTEIPPLPEMVINGTPLNRHAVHMIMGAYEIANEHLGVGVPGTRLNRQQRQAQKEKDRIIKRNALKLYGVYPDIRIEMDGIVLDKRMIAYLYHALNEMMKLFRQGIYGPEAVPVSSDGDSALYMLIQGTRRGLQVAYKAGLALLALIERKPVEDYQRRWDDWEKIFASIAEEYEAETGVSVYEDFYARFNGLH